MRVPSFPPRVTRRRKVVPAGSLQIPGGHYGHYGQYGQYGQYGRYGRYRPFCGTWAGSRPRCRPP